MLKSALALAALLALAAACSGDDNGETGSPGDGHASLVTRTMLLDWSEQQLRLVDPATIEPIDGYEPIDMGHWANHHPSPDGRVMASIIGDDQQPDATIHMFDLVDWEEIGTVDGTFESPYHLVWTPAGDRFYFIESFSSWSNLWSVDVDSRESTKIALVTYAIEQIDVSPDGDQLYLFAFDLRDPATRTPDGNPFVAVLDSSSGNEIGRVAVPGALVGQIQENGADVSGWTMYGPGLSLSPDAEHYFVAHAESGNVTKIDLNSMEVVRTLTPEPRQSLGGRIFGRVTGLFVDTAEAKGVSHRTKQMIASPDGEYLYIAASREDNPTEKDAGRHLGTLSIVRTDDLSLVLEQEGIDSISLSPNGSRLYGTGWTYDWQPADHDAYEVANVQGYGLHVLDTTTMEFTDHATPDAVYQQLHISGDGAHVYLISDASWHWSHDCESPCQELSIFEVASGQTTTASEYGSHFIDVVTTGYTVE